MLSEISTGHFKEFAILGIQIFFGIGGVVTSIITYYRRDW